MKSLKSRVLASLVMLPFAGASQAADLDPADVTVNNASAFYLRGDIGASFLDWKHRNRTGFVGGAGFGYRFNENLRADATYDWAGKYKAHGKHMNSSALLGNLYFDIPTSTAFTPYVGAGAGYGWLRHTTHGNKSGFALGLMAGVSVDVTDNVALDVGYRFKDTMISGHDPKENQLQVGVRYSF